MADQNPPLPDEASDPELLASARLAARALHADGVIAYPTESVWGLGCDPASEQATERLLALKRRPRAKGVILVAADLDQVEHLLAPLPPAMRATAGGYWPGFVTCVIPDLARQVPEWIRGNHDTVAVRVSRHPAVAALCRAFGGPVVSTSCNPAGQPPALLQTEAERYFPEGVDYFMAGTTLQNAGPSPIVDLISGSYLRR